MLEEDSLEEDNGATTTLVLYGQEETYDMNTALDAGREPIAPTSSQRQTMEPTARGREAACARRRAAQNASSRSDCDQIPVAADNRLSFWPLLSWRM